MYIDRKPNERVGVDWAGDPAQIIEPYSRKSIPTFLFVGVPTYNPYSYVETFTDEKQHAWITAHIHMYKCFGGCRLSG